MVDRFNISLQGDKELQKALKGFEPKLGRKVIRGAVREGAKLVQREAKAKTPILDAETRIGPGSQFPNPGSMRKAITVRAGRRKRQHYRVNATFKDREKLGITGKGFAPAAIEFGRGSGKRHGPEIGIHFMRDAYLRKRRIVDSTIIDKMRNGLFKIWKQDTKRPT